MAIHHERQRECSISEITKEGTCRWSYWRKQRCYCTNTEGTQIKGLLGCPYAWQDFGNSDTFIGNL